MQWRSVESTLTKARIAVPLPRDYNIRGFFGPTWVCFQTGSRSVHPFLHNRPTSCVQHTNHGSLLTFCLGLCVSINNVTYISHGGVFKADIVSRSNWAVLYTFYNFLTQLQSPDHCLKALYLEETMLSGFNSSIHFAVESIMIMFKSIRYSDVLV